MLYGIMNISEINSVFSVLILIFLENALRPALTKALKDTGGIVS